MKIENHRLIGDDGYAVPFYASPNKTNYIISPKLLVVHYTAGSNPLGTISWFTSAKAYASAHLLIDREGKIYQFVPLNLMAWHAGNSKWKDPDNKNVTLVGINKYSIGIELDNGGCAKWVQSMDSNKKMWAKHKNSSYTAFWEIYSQVQLDTFVKVSRLLVETYNIKEMVGHDDIAPGSKVDPGPAFPFSTIEKKVFEKEQTQPIEQTHPVEIIPPKTLEERVSDIEKEIISLKEKVITLENR